MCFNRGWKTCHRNSNKHQTSKTEILKVKQSDEKQNDLVVIKDSDGGQLYNIPHLIWQ